MNPDQVAQTRRTLKQMNDAVALSRLIRPDKLGVDPTLEAIALYLHPIPITLRNFEACAFGWGPNNSSSGRGCRPDVYAGTLHKSNVLVLRRRHRARHGVSSRCSRGNLERGLDRRGRGRIRPGDRCSFGKRWFRVLRSRLNRSGGRGLHCWTDCRSFRLFFLTCGWSQDVRKGTYGQCRHHRSADKQLSLRSKSREDFFSLSWGTGWKKYSSPPVAYVCSTSLSGNGSAQELAE
jgi:hypothetical protein